jgi:uncharacterized protein YvpB
VLGLNRLTSRRRIRLLICLTLALTISIETSVVAGDQATFESNQPRNPTPQTKERTSPPPDDQVSSPQDGEAAPGEPEQSSAEVPPSSSTENSPEPDQAGADTADSAESSGAAPEGDQQSVVEAQSVATAQPPPPPPQDLRVSHPLGISMWGHRHTDCRGFNEVIVGRPYAVNSNINADGIVRLRLIDDANGNDAFIGESGLQGGQARWDLTAHTPGDFTLKTEFLGTDQVLPTESSLIRLRFVPVSWSYFGDGGLRLEVPWLRQQFSLSCESASLRSALAFHGVDTGGDLPIILRIGLDARRRSRGRWGNPETHFVGHYNGRMMSRGYGVHSGPIARVANSYRPCNSASELRNASDAEIAGHINNGFPVEVWGANARRRARPTAWRAWDGGVVTAWNGEHTWLVVGFRGPAWSPTHFVIHDPSRTRRGGAFKELTLTEFHGFTKYFASPTTSRAVVIR